MIKLVLMMVTLLGLVSVSNAAVNQDCDYVQASVSNIKSVAASYGAKSMYIESKFRRLSDPAVSFSFVDSKGDLYLGVNHINRESCQTSYYNIQKSANLKVD